jgi:hypothetical protein
MSMAVPERISENGTLKGIPGGFKEQVLKSENQEYRFGLDERWHQTKIRQQKGRVIGRGPDAYRH